MAPTCDFEKKSVKLPFSDLGGGVVGSAQILSNLFNQFLGKFDKIVCCSPPLPRELGPHLEEILDPPLVGCRRRVHPAPLRSATA